MKFTASFLAYLCVGVLIPTATSAEDKKPNFIVILTDDQDLRMGSMDYMPRVKEHLTDHGLFFNSHYATVSLCCPSRASMWTGKAAHNTNITDLKPPYGGYPKFIEEGYHKKWLPTFLQKAGYRTYFTGKLMNTHTIKNYHRGLDDMGLDGHDFMIEPGTYQYLNTTIQHNQEEPKSYPHKYATDLLTEKSLAWVDEAAKEEAPFFLAINPVNPHGNHEWGNGWTPPIPAKRHKGAFPDAKVPRNVSFNPDEASGAAWVRELEKLTDKQIKENDHQYRRRLESLLSVDDMVHETIKRLEKHDMLDNTYIIYTTDNGFHISQHRLTPGKRCPYEEDVNVPLVIRGPGIPEGKTADFVTSHLDIAPTIVDWAGAEGPGDFDGSAIPKDGKVDPNEPWEHVEIEHWGFASDKKVPVSDRSNTYKALRVIGPEYNLYYSVWCGGDHEVYDMMDDPYQMKNLYNTDGNILDVPKKKLEHRLDALLLVLKTCKGKTCRRPWEALHPAGDVKTLLEALDTKFDDFYKNQHKVSFKKNHKCGRGYIVKNELPIDYLTFGEHETVESRNEEALKNWELFTD